MVKNIYNKLGILYLIILIVLLVLFFMGIIPITLLDKILITCGFLIGVVAITNHLKNRKNESTRTGKQ